MRGVSYETDFIIMNIFKHKNVERIEVLPYHTLGAYKWKELGLGYPLEGIDPPTEKQLQIANTILETGK